eukprot:766421-Hanusia_phi.AAC.7
MTTIQEIKIHEDALFPLLHMLMRQLELLSLTSAARKSERTSVRLASHVVADIVTLYGEVMGRATMLVRDIQNRGVGLSPQTYLYAAHLATLVNSPSTSLLSHMALSQVEESSTAAATDPKQLQQAQRKKKINEFVSMLANLRDRRDVEGSVQVLKMMRDEGVKPNEKIYAAVVREQWRERREMTRRAD